MLGERVGFYSGNGDLTAGYMARPVGPGPYPGVIVIHEVFGLVEHTKEIARRFAARGYIAIALDLYHRESPGGPDEEIINALRQSGGIPDARIVQDLHGALKTLRAVATCSGKVGCIGYCSGGRNTLMFACNSRDLSAAVVCYGGRVVTTELTPNQPKAVVDMVSNLGCPVLGLFGAEDQNPSPEHVARLEAELTKHGKQYTFKSYPGAGHGFFADYRPSYRQEAATDGWEKVFDFFGRHLK
ncbi:MAG: dienelactone hydrolase family protein [Chloroflexi bacterium]|nr:dienelactone hydrolase family protein [Chloroflexota bacterium]